MITLYIAFCMIWSVFFTGYMFRNWKKLPDKDQNMELAIIVAGFFIITALFAPYSMWKNLPFIIKDFQKE